MPRDIDIGLLRAFTAVIEAGSVTGAARLLNRTQAAVSLQIKRLEEQLGVELFLREHRRLRLTKSGERMLAGAHKIVSLNDELWSAMTTPAVRGEVRLGVPMDIIQTYVPAVLRRFNQAWPQVDVTVDCRNSYDLLLAIDNGEVDVALTTDDTIVKSSTRLTETLRMDRLVWVGTQGARAHRTDPLPLAIGSPTCRFRPVVLDALRAQGRDWRLVTEVANDIAQKAVIQADIAIGANLKDSIATGLYEIEDPSLPALPQFAINLTLPATGGSDAARELARHVRQEFAVRYGPVKLAA